MRKIGILSTAIALIFGSASAQQMRMTLDECITRAVSANFGLEIAGYETRQAENNVTISQFVPTVTGTARQNRTDVSRTKDNKSVNSLGAGMSLNWRIFDGMGMFATHNRQKEQLTASELRLRRELETLVSDVMIQYYLLISLHNQKELAEELMELSQLRYKEAMDKAEIGSASKLEMRLAKIDLNADSSNLIRQEETLRIAYIEMNRLMNCDLNEDNYVSDSIEVHELLHKDELTLWAEENNVSILLAKSGVRLSDEDYRLAKSGRYPTLDFATGYNVNATDAPNFQGNFQNSHGVNWGFNLGINIFNGMETNRKVRNARLDQSISQTSLSDTELSIKSDLDKLYLNYINNLQLIDFEHENADVARLNLEAAMLRYRIGDLSGIDFRNIQQQYLSAVNRKINVLYQAKVSEVRLMMLAGQLEQLD